MSEKYKILIADSQYLVVKSLTHLIESEMNFSICGVADTRTVLINILNSCTPSILITDVNLIDYNGFDDLVSIKNSSGKEFCILVLSNQLTGIEVSQLIRSGIKNITLKTAQKDEIIYSIDMALKNRRHLSDDVLDLLVEVNLQNSPAQDQTGLTPAETEMIRMIAGGLTTREIASKKNISIHTVMTHRKNIFRKLTINKVSDLTRFAIRTGLIDNDIDFNI